MVHRVPRSAQPEKSLRIVVIRSSPLIILLAGFLLFLIIRADGFMMG
jgi:hypothetical protein